MKDKAEGIAKRAMEVAVALADLETATRELCYLYGDVQADRVHHEWIGRASAFFDIAHDACRRGATALSVEFHFDLSDEPVTPSEAPAP